MKPSICFGEILGRFCPPDHLRISQAMPGYMEVTFAGAEVNVAVAISRLGGNSEFVSALPMNPIADAAVAAVRAVGVGTRWLLRRDLGRCGLYFVETGANQRGGRVYYDRDGSTFCLSGAETYPWPDILSNAGWFHTSGVATSVSEVAAAATLAGVAAARAAGVPVSYDINFRRKLWRWKPGVSPSDLARQTLLRLAPDIDILIGNAYDLADLIGEVFTGDPGDLHGCTELVRRVGTRLPHLRWIAMTLRQNHSATHNLWSALLYRPADGVVFDAPRRAGRHEPYVIGAIVDRIGTGDAFAGALILALQTPRLAEPGHALAFATAAACLEHSTRGDFFQSSIDEVERLMNGDDAGHVSR